MQNRETNPSLPNSMPRSYVSNIPSYTAPYRATLHPTAIWCTLSATLHSCEPSCTFLSYAASSWATVHTSELRCISLSYAAPFGATVCPSKLHFKPLSYTCNRWATQHPLSYAASSAWAKLHAVPELSCMLPVIYSIVSCTPTGLPI